jgi:hypothetical protein
MTRVGAGARARSAWIIGFVGWAALVATAVPAAAHDPDPILGGGLYAQNLGLEYRWSGAGAPPSAMKSAINEAADDANGSRRSKSPTFHYDSGATNVVYYGTDVPCGVNGLACMRRDPPDWFGVWFRENGHRFDWGTLRWCELSGAPDGCYQVENVMLDELGHVLVLDHHDNYGDDRDYDDAVVQTYSRTKPRSGWNAHVFGRCDVATLQQQYDVASATTPYSTCLDVPTSLSVSASRTSVVAGSMVTFTASLGSDGTGKLSNNAISSRTVVLQQRLASGWSDLVTMGAGASAGTYTTSVNIWASRDYRALFRKPANEGLQASSSAAVTVSATPACQGTCPQSVIGGNAR